MLTFIENFIALFVESAPWLVLGFVVAGGIKTLIPKAFLSKQLGGKGFLTTVKAAFIGAPLPLCSCGVVPAALGLRRSGASKNSTVSFLVATPETGVDSIAVTYALLGPVMAIVRPIAAITSGILSGVLVGKSEGGNALTDTLTNTQKKSGCCSNKADKAPVKSSCCSRKTELQAVPASGCCSSKVQSAPKSTCCGSTASTPTQQTDSLPNKIASGLRFSFDDMLKDISLWLVIGLVFAAAVETWIPASFLAQWGSGVLAFLVMSVIGIPMYICATASTPIAAGLLMAGVSPGAVLVFMMVGPATNLGTLAIVARELGNKALAAYLTGVIVTSYCFGYMLNILVEQQNWRIAAQVHGHGEHTSWLAYICALVLAVAIARIGLIKMFPKPTGQQINAS